MELSEESIYITEVIMYFGPVLITQGELELRHYPPGCFLPFSFYFLLSRLAPVPLILG